MISPSLVSICGIVNGIAAIVDKYEHSCKAKKLGSSLSSSLPQPLVPFEDLKWRAGLVWLTELFTPSPLSCNLWVCSMSSLVLPLMVALV